MSSMRLRLLLSVTIIGSVHPALAQTADVDCPAEIAAFLATVRADQAYSRIAPTFGETEAGLDAAMRTDGADCLVMLRDAQRSLVDAGVVVTGASDDASVERVALLIDGGSATEVKPTLRTVEVVPQSDETMDTSEMAVVAVEPAAPGTDDTDAPDVAAAPDVTAVPEVNAVPDVSVAPTDVPSAESRPVPPLETATSTDAGTQDVMTREVEFGFDSADVPDDARSDVLSEVAGLVGSNPGTAVLLTGHASPIGDADYNLRLSERRVTAVAAALQALGVPEAAISMQAQGEESPEVPAAEDELSEENRRVEIRVVVDGTPDRG